MNPLDALHKAHHTHPKCSTYSRLKDGLLPFKQKVSMAFILLKHRRRHNNCMATYIIMLHAWQGSVHPQTCHFYTCYYPNNRVTFSFQCKVSATITVIVDNVFFSYKTSLPIRWRTVQRQILRVVSTSFVVFQSVAASLILHYEQASMIESDSMAAMLLRRVPLLNMIRDVSRCSVLILS